jgi:dGTPase
MRCSKYPWFRELDPRDPSKPATEQDPAEHDRAKTKKARKWGAYTLERDAFDRARALYPTKGSDRKSPEAEIMDWADDLTFAVHDAEDFYRAGLIPLDRLTLTDDAERTLFFDGIQQRPELLHMVGGRLTSEYTEAFYKVVIGFPLDVKYAGSTAQRSQLRDFASAQIEQFIDAFELVEPQTADQPFVQIDPVREKMVKMLKLLTWHYVILNPSLATQQHGQRMIIRTLFSTFYDAAKGGKDDIFPHAFRDAVREAKEEDPKLRLVTRTVADLISGMTERQAVEMYQRLTGISLGSVLNSIL